MIIFIASSLCIICIYADGGNKDSVVIIVNESLYDKETVPVDNTYACQVGCVSACEMPVLLNKMTKKIEYYWSTADNKWVVAGDQQTALQAMYDKREEIRTQRQLKSMQDEINKLHKEDMEKKAPENVLNHR